ncbi:sugar isomerase [Saccharopolyspora erythraea]|uniref:SIS domain-containing protein n=1 Tax=Saccharopolyspora erythraea TaxID=1836 RepID=UPI001BA6E573|nr:sugar isomerase [Saccharopolyspora erythraea]QUH04723.1 sugar isomerase [Saccharopolyspora erythraea]
MTQSFARTEISSQPGLWRQAAGLAGSLQDLLPADGARLAVVGCGTSWFMGQSYAALRENGGRGRTDAFTPSEMPLSRSYDHVLAITRSGTTTEVLRLLDDLRGRIPTTVITATPDPVAGRADTVVDLSSADERSVVQTRFATTALALLRAHLGENLGKAVADAEAVLAEPLPRHLLEAEQFTFLGTGWTVGLAHEAALKFREAARFWTESYPALEYRHGPISIAEPGRVTWMFGTAPHGLADDVAATGGIFAEHAVDPMADLVRAQRVAVELAERRGLDPDHPRSLTRSVLLEEHA